MNQDKKTNKNKEEDNSLKGEIELKNKKSSLSEFVKRPLPSDEEIEEFEEMVEEEAREEDIEESLSEIYQDDDGEVVDVSKFAIKKKRGILFYFFSFIFLLAIIGGIGYGLYYILFERAGSSNNIEFKVESEENILAGEEFFYTIRYRNPNKINVKDVQIEVDYPDNFVFIDSMPAPSSKNSIWNLDSIVAYNSGSIKIKGKIIDEKDTTSVLDARISYIPENFSSEFKKDTSITTNIKDIGLDFNFTYSSNALVGEENEIEIGIEKHEDNYLDNFILEAETAENLEYLNFENKNEEADETDFKIEQIRNNVWEISGLSEENEDLFLIKYKIKEKAEDEQELKFAFKQSIEEEEGGKDYIFLEEVVSIDVMNSDLNLSLEINESKGDTGIDFNQKLNYKISYINKGDEAMKDVVIMAVLDSDFLDWTTLDDSQNGREKGNTIFWTKEEIKDLESLGVDQGGEINFSINVMPFREIDLGEKFEVKSYAQYSVGEKEDIQENNDNRSNTIINQINSDLDLSEEIRYFDDDNMPVGTGPLPPENSKTTSFKVYWTITNNLHELNNTQVETVLPNNVSWENKNRTSVGTINYDSESRTITWNIGRMPTSVYRADAEFSISITPTEEDVDKIMVLLSGSKVSAIDTETSSSISKSSKAKTTKLESDEIAQMNNDGIVR